MNPPVSKAEVLILGDRNYPLHPTIKISALMTAPLPGLLDTAQRRMPDITYDDLIKAVWVLGVRQMTVALEAGLHIERGGLIEAELPPPTNKQQRGPTAVEASRRIAAKQAILGEGDSLTATFKAPDALP